MRVTVAKTAGFCSGVRDALERTLQVRRQTPKEEVIYTFGPLIHNQQVLAMLEEKGVKETSSIAQCAGKKVIIRAHGVPPDVRKQLKEVGARVVDATCKRVARVQAVIKRYARKGYRTIIVGDETHAEVIGLLGFTEGKGYVIREPHQIDQFPENWDRVILVAQTTQNRRLFEKIEERFRKRYPHGVVINTICGATDERQREVRELCSKVDAMVIVGGYHSANTIRLAEVARECLVPTYHIETEKDLNPERLANYETVGVSAGASTPNWMIRNVVDFLESIQPKHHRKRRWLRTISNLLSYTGIIGTLGAALLVATVSALTRLPASLGSGVVAFCYIFSMHSLNHYPDREAVQLNDPDRAAFYRRWQYPFVFLSILSLIVAFAVALSRGFMVFLFLLLLTILGALYAVPVMKGFRNREISIIKFRDIPASRTFAIATAWTAVTVMLPHLFEFSSSFRSLLFASWIIFLLSLSRTAFMDYLDIHGDRLAGRETIAVYLGERRTIRFLYTALLAFVFSLLLAPLFDLNPLVAYSIIPFALCYIYFLSNWSQFKGTGSVELLIDGVIVAIGLIGLIEVFLSRYYVAG